MNDSSPPLEIPDVTTPEIIQDHEYDGDIGSPLAVFWAKGHGYDERDFIRAVLDYCLDNDVDIPAITEDDLPVETWQQNVAQRDAIEYRRDPTPPTSPRSPRFPITLLDLEGARRHGGTKCAVDNCTDPWSVGTPAKVRIEPDSDEADLRYMAVRMWFCREHAKRFPQPTYRVCMVPVGATILLPAETASGGAA